MLSRHPGKRFFRGVTFACLAVLASACDSGSRDAVILPRERELTGDDRGIESDLNYDPSVRALAWTAGGDLIIQHFQRYSRHDVYVGVCGASGIYALTPGGIDVRAVSTGANGCAAAVSGDLTLDRTGRFG